MKKKIFCVSLFCGVAVVVFLGSSCNGPTNNTPTKTYITSGGKYLAGSTLTYSWATIPAKATMSSSNALVSYNFNQQSYPGWNPATVTGTGDKEVTFVTPTDYHSESFLIKIVSNNDSIVDSINLTWIILDSPKGGNVYKVGDIIPVKWHGITEKVGNVGVSMSINEGKNWTDIHSGAITTSDQSYGNYQWTIPSTLTFNGTATSTGGAGPCVIQVYQYGNFGVVDDQNDTDFTVNAAQ